MRVRVSPGLLKWFKALFRYCSGLSLICGPQGLRTLVKILGEAVEPAG
ncbi:MAG: hypothetical protein QXR97_02325 [Thermoproteota archaeon]